MWRPYKLEKHLSSCKSRVRCHARTILPSWSPLPPLTTAYCADATLLSPAIRSCQNSRCYERIRQHPRAIRHPQWSVRIMSTAFVHTDIAMHDSMLQWSHTSTNNCVSTRCVIVISCKEKMSLPWLRKCRVEALVIIMKYTMQCTSGFIPPLTTANLPEASLLFPAKRWCHNPWRTRLDIHYHSLAVIGSPHGHSKWLL